MRGDGPDLVVLVDLMEDRVELEGLADVNVPTTFDPCRAEVRVLDGVEPALVGRIVLNQDLVVVKGGMQINTGGFELLAGEWVHVDDSVHHAGRDWVDIKKLQSTSARTSRVAGEENVAGDSMG